MWVSLKMSYISGICFDDNLRITVCKYWGLCVGELSLNVGISCASGYPPGCPVVRQQGYEPSYPQEKAIKKSRLPCG